MTRPLLAGAALLLAAGPAPAQREAPVDVTIPADGTEVFRYLLHLRGVRPLTTAEFYKQQPGGNPGLIVIVVGTVPEASFQGRTASRWGGETLRGGGACLIATDSEFYFSPPFGGPAPGISYGVYPWRFTQTNPEGTYAGVPACPLALPLPPPRGVRGPEWGLFAGLNRVATNKPGSLPLLAPRDEFRSRLAALAPGVRMVGNENVRIDPADPRYTLAVGGSVPVPGGTGEPCRFLAVADRDVFANEMMVPIPGVEPADNLALANRVVEYLVKTDDGRQERKLCLFVQDGKVVPRFDTLKTILDPAGPMPNLQQLPQILEKLADAANEVVDKAQTNDAPSRLLLGGDEGKRREVVRYIAQALLAAAAVWAALVILLRVWKSRHPAGFPPAPPGGRPAVPAGARPAGVFDRRQQELLRRDDLSEPVRLVVRDLFRTAGAPADAGPRLPRVRVAESVRRPDTLTDALEDLWDIGFGRPRRLAAREWAALEPIFLRVQKAHADGKWAFVWYEPGDS